VWRDRRDVSNRRGEGQPAEDEFERYRHSDEIVVLIVYP
jgi:hypothetical protein